MLKKLELILFIGLPASGKSFFYREYFSNTHVWISKDHFRKAKNRERKQFILIKNALIQGRSVVVDNTHVSCDERAPILDLGRRLGAHVIGYFFNATVDACKERNALRLGDESVPNVALFDKVKRLTRPTYQEGFDELFDVEIVSPWGFKITDRKHVLSSLDECP